MKQSKKILVSSLLAMGLFGGGIVFANTWTIGYTNVPAWGGGGTTSESNVKTTSSNVASFNGDSLPNSFGYNVRIVNSNGAVRSDYVGLYKNQTTHAGNNTAQINYYVYANVHSKAVEPNSSTVKLHFSGDNK